MKLHTDYRSAGGHRITAYGPGYVTVNGTVCTGAVLLGEGSLATDTDLRRSADLNNIALDQLREQDPEIVIIGTGARHVFPPPELFKPLIHDGIGVEVMSTPAACRTYNILSSEGRRVVALLLPIEHQSC